LKGIMIGNNVKKENERGLAGLSTQGGIGDFKLKGQGGGIDRGCWWGKLVKSASGDAELRRGGKRGSDGL